MQAADGTLVLQRSSGRMIWGIDKYFPRLEKRIEKGSGTVVTPDDMSNATPTEKKLVAAMEALMKRRTN